jgi:hypothetical protein
MESKVPILFSQHFKILVKIRELTDIVQILQYVIINIAHKQVNYVQEDENHKADEKNNVSPV